MLLAARGLVLSGNDPTLAHPKGAGWRFITLEKAVALAVGFMTYAHVVLLLMLFHGDDASYVMSAMREAQSN